MVTTPFCAEPACTGDTTFEAATVSAGWQAGFLPE